MDKPGVCLVAGVGTHCLLEYTEGVYCEPAVLMWYRYTHLPDGELELGGLTKHGCRFCLPPLARPSLSDPLGLRSFLFTVVSLPRKGEN